MIKRAHQLKPGDSISMRAQKMDAPFDYELYTYVIAEIIDDGPAIRLTSNTGETLSFARNEATEVINEQVFTA